MGVRLLVGAVLLTAPLAFAGATDADGWTEATYAVMSTEVTVRVPSASADLLPVAHAVFDDVDARANEWRSASPIGRLNAAGGAPVAVPDDLRALLRRGQVLSAQTHGAFDVTWASLWGLWDFRAVEPELPDALAVAEAVVHVGAARMVFDDAAGTVALVDPGARVGLGAFSKGWALDRVGAAFLAAGVDHFLVRAGGQVLAGAGPDGRPWRVGIQDPRGVPGDAFATLDVSGVSVSTSGDYERYFVRDGVRYHHILDPRTGWPARGATSVTVVSPDATLADALSTALLVLDPSDALDVVRSLGVDAVIVRATGEVLATSGLKHRLTVVHPPGSGP